MTDKPIPYSPLMIIAKREGRKTMTRRVIKPQPEFLGPGGCESDPTCWGLEDLEYGFVSIIQNENKHLPVEYPFKYSVGDRLWNREAWRTKKEFDHLPPREIPVGSPVEYLADGTNLLDGKYRHGRFMCRWMSRMTDIVTGLKVERLQDISAQDAIAEGVSRIKDHCYAIKGFDYDLAGLCHSSAVIPFAKLWEHINGPDSWDENPFVAAYSFDVHHCNIDKLGEQKSQTKNLANQNNRIFDNKLEASHAE